MKAKCLIDIDVSIISYVKNKYVKQYKIFLISFAQLIQLKLVNEFVEEQITHAAKIKIILENHREQL